MHSKTVQVAINRVKPEKASVGLEVAWKRAEIGIEELTDKVVKAAVGRHCSQNEGVEKEIQHLLGLGRLRMCAPLEGERS